VCACQILTLEVREITGQESENELVVSHATHWFCVENQFTTPAATISNSCETFIFSTFDTKIGKKREKNRGELSEVRPGVEPFEQFSTLKTFT
jgi:hypothetical protein